jgi:hypothetical protein
VQNGEGLLTEGDVFVDAHDQGSNGGSDSEMEFVAETVSLAQ